MKIELPVIIEVVIDKKVLDKCDPRGTIIYDGPLATFFKEKMRKLLGAKFHIMALSNEVEIRETQYHTNIIGRYKLNEPFKSEQLDIVESGGTFSTLAKLQKDGISKGNQGSNRTGNRERLR